MAWNDITTSDEYKQLSPRGRSRLKQRFFEESILPDLASISDEGKQKAFNRFMETPDDTGEGAIRSATSAFARGALRPLSDIPIAVGALTGSEGIEDFGKDIQGGIESAFPVNPAQEGFFTTEIPGVAGQVTSMIGTGLGAGAAARALAGSTAAAKLGAKAAVGTQAFTGGAAGGAQRADELGLEGGQKQFRTFLGGATELGVEALPFGMLTETGAIRKLLGETGEQAAKRSVESGWMDFIPQPIREGVKTEAIEEGFTEGIGQATDIAFAPEQANMDLQQIGKAMLLGGVGGAMFGGVNAAIAPKTAEAFKYEGEFVRVRDINEAPAEVQQQFAVGDTSRLVLDKRGKVIGYKPAAETIEADMPTEIVLPDDIAPEIVPEVTQMVDGLAQNPTVTQTAKALAEDFQSGLTELPQPDMQANLLTGVPMQPTSAPADATKPTQTITGSNVQTGTEMPVLDESPVTSPGVAPLTNETTATTDDMAAVAEAAEEAPALAGGETEVSGVSEESQAELVAAWEASPEFAAAEEAAAAGDLELAEQIEEQWVQQQGDIVENVVADEAAAGMVEPMREETQFSATADVPTDSLPAGQLTPGGVGAGVAVKPARVGNTAAIPTQEESERWAAADEFNTSYIQQLESDDLDAFGAKVGVRRQGISDAAYRSKILGNSHPDDILDAIPDATPAPQAQPPATTTATQETQQEAAAPPSVTATEESTAAEPAAAIVELTELPLYFQRNPNQKKLWNVDETYAEPTKPANPVGDEVGSRGTAFTVEQLMYQIATLREAVSSMNGRLMRGGDKGASSKQLAENWTTLRGYEALAAEYASKNPDEWQAYMSRQDELLGLEAGADVLVPYPSPDTAPLGNIGKLDKKFAKNWRVTLQSGETVLLHPTALRPVPQAAAPVAIEQAPPLTQQQSAIVDKLPELEARDAQRRGLGFDYPRAKVGRLPNDQNAYISRPDQKSLGVLSPDGGIKMLSPEESLSIQNEINAFEQRQKNQIDQRMADLREESKRQSESKLYQLTPSGPIVRRRDGKWINDRTGKPLGRSKNDQRLLSQLENNPNIELFQVVAQVSDGGISFVPLDRAAEPAAVEADVAGPSQRLRDYITTLPAKAQAAWTPERLAAADSYYATGDTAALEPLTKVQQKVVKERATDDTEKLRYEAEQKRAFELRNPPPVTESEFLADPNALLDSQTEEQLQQERARRIEYRRSTQPPIPPLPKGPIQAIHFSREPLSLKDEVSQEDRDNVFGNGFYAMELQDEPMWTNMGRWEPGEFRNEVEITVENPLVITPDSYLDLFAEAEKQREERGYARTVLDSTIVERMEAGGHDAIIIRGFDQDQTWAMSKEVDNRIRKEFVPKFEEGRTEGRFTNVAERNSIGERISQEIAGMSFGALNSLSDMQNQIFVPPKNASSMVSVTRLAAPHIRPSLLRAQDGTVLRTGVESIDAEAARNSYDGVIPGVEQTWIGTTADFAEQFPDGYPFGTNLTFPAPHHEALTANDGRPFIFTDQVQIHEGDVARAREYGTTPGVEAVKRTLRHESFAHRGFMALPHPLKRRFMDLIESGVIPQAELDYLVTERGYSNLADWRDNISTRQMAAEEWLAHKLERMTELPKSGPVAEFLDWLRDVWDYLTGGAKSNDAVLRDTLRAMHKALGALEPGQRIIDEQVRASRGSTSLRVRQTRQALIQATEESSDWKDWYQRHEDTLYEFFGEDADLFQQILSVTSQAASVKANVGLALKAYVQLKTNVPFEGFLPAVAKNLERVRSDTEIKGQKISAYQQANTGADEVVVVDRHISRMLFGVDSPTAKQFKKGQQVLTEIANKLGWQPRQVQAAMWAASIRKSGKTPESYDSYIRELNRRGTLFERIGSVVPTSFGNQTAGGAGGFDTESSGEAGGGIGQSIRASRQSDPINNNPSFSSASVPKTTAPRNPNRMLSEIQIGADGIRRIIPKKYLPFSEDGKFGADLKEWAKDLTKVKEASLMDLRRLLMVIRDPARTQTVLGITPQNGSSIIPSILEFAAMRADALGNTSLGNIFRTERAGVGSQAGQNLAAIKAANLDEEFSPNRIGNMIQGIEQDDQKSRVDPDINPKNVIPEVKATLESAGDEASSNVEDGVNDETMISMRILELGVAAEDDPWLRGKLEELVAAIIDYGEAAAETDVRASIADKRVASKAAPADRMAVAAETIKRINREINEHLKKKTKKATPVDGEKAKATKEPKEKLPKPIQTAKEIIDSIAKKVSGETKAKPEPNKVRTLYKQQLKQPKVEAEFLKEALALGVDAVTAKKLFDSINLEIVAVSIGAQMASDIRQRNKELKKAEDELQKTQKKAEAKIKEVAERLSDPSLTQDAKKAQEDEFRRIYNDQVKRGGQEDVFVQAMQDLGVDFETARSLYDIANLDSQSRREIRQAQDDIRRAELSESAASRLIYAQEEELRQGSKDRETNDKGDSINKAFREQLTKPLELDAFISRLAALKVSAKTAERLYKTAERVAFDNAMGEAFAKRIKFLDVDSSALANFVNDLRRRGKLTGEAIDWRNLLSMPVTDQFTIKETLLERIKMHSAMRDLTASEQQALADALEIVWQKERRKLFQQMIKRAERKGMTKDAKQRIEDATPKLLEYINQGMLASDAFYAAVGEQYGWQPVSKEDRAKLEKLAAEMQEPGISSMERNMKQEEIVRVLQRNTRLSRAEVLSSFWVMSVLTGGRTHLDMALGILSGALSILKKAVAVATTGKDPKLALKGLSDFGKFMVIAGEQSYNYVMKGESGIILNRRSALNDSFTKDKLSNVLPTGDKLMLLQDKPGDSEWQLTKNKLARGLGKFMGFWERLMAGWDHITASATYHGTMRLASGLNPKLFDAALIPNDADWENAMAMAKLRRPGASRAQTTALAQSLLIDGIRSLGREIEESRMDQWRNMVAQAMAEGSTASYQETPTGFGGVVYGAVRRITEGTEEGAKWWSEKQKATYLENMGPINALFKHLGELGYIIATQSQNILGVKFMRFTGNKLNELISYVPVLGLGRLREEGMMDNGEYTLRGRNVYHNQALGWTALTLYIYMMTRLDEPDEEKNIIVEGSWENLTPARKSQLMAAGRKPNTVRIKTSDGKELSFNYVSWPFAGWLAGFGSLSDVKRYTPDKWTEKTVADKTMSAAYAGAFAISDISSLSSLSELFGRSTYSTDPTEAFVKRISKAGSNYVGGFMPKFIKDIDSWFDDSAYRPENTWQHLAAQMPLLRRSAGAPVRDIFYEPVNVSRAPWSRAIQMSPDEQEYMLLGRLNSRGIWLTPPNADNRKVKSRTGRSRDMTEEEAVKYMQLTGEGYKQMLQQHGERLLSMDTDAAARLVEKYSARVRERALKKAVARGAATVTVEAL